jgi:hypothetical protein
MIHPIEGKCDVFGTHNNTKFGEKTKKKKKKKNFIKNKLHFLKLNRLFLVLIKKKVVVI